MLEANEEIHPQRIEERTDLQRKATKKTQVRKALRTRKDVEETTTNTCAFTLFTVLPLGKAGQEQPTSPEAAY